MSLLRRLSPAAAGERAAPLAGRECIGAVAENTLRDWLRQLATTNPTQAIRCASI